MGFLEKAANAFGIKTAEQKTAEAKAIEKRRAEAKKTELERLRRLGIIERPAEPEPLHAATYTATAKPEEQYVVRGSDEFSRFEKKPVETEKKSSGSKNLEELLKTLEMTEERDRKHKEIIEKNERERERNAQLAGKLVDYFNTHKDEEYEPGKTFAKNLEKFAERLLSEGDPELIAATEALYPQHVREQALLDAAVEGHIVERYDQKDFSYFADKAMILTKLQKTTPRYN